MAKERKSKHQKQVSDKRHSQSSPLEKTEHLYSLSASTPSSSKMQKSATISTSDYAYLTGDLKKFVVVTVGIIAVEMGIYWTSIGF